MEFEWRWVLLSLCNLTSVSIRGSTWIPSLGCLRWEQKDPKLRGTTCVIHVSRFSETGTGVSVKSLSQVVLPYSVLVNVASAPRRYAVWFRIIELVRVRVFRNEIRASVMGNDCKHCVCWNHSLNIQCAITFDRKIGFGMVLENYSVLASITILRPL
jgi:hypothetical protein